MEQAVYPGCGIMFAGQTRSDSLKNKVANLRCDHRMDNGHAFRDYYPRCNRMMLGLTSVWLSDTAEPVFYGTRGPDK